MNNIKIFENDMHADIDLSSEKVIGLAALSKNI